MVLADVGAPHLYRDLIGEQHLPQRLIRDLDRFQWDAPTMKVNWTFPARFPGSHRKPTEPAPFISVST